MKKLVLFILVICFIPLMSCKKEDFMAELISEAGAPFKEYEMKYNKEIEKDILENEIARYNLNKETTTANVIEMTKIGNYVKGTVRIIGDLTDESLKKYEVKNKIVTYDCYFEKSYNKNGKLVWRSGFPY